MSQRLFLLSILFVMVFASAISVIYVKQQSRDLYSELRVLQKQQDILTIDWSRLQIQNSTLSNAAYVEKIARQKLQMKTVKHPQYVVLR